MLDSWYLKNVKVTGSSLWRGGEAGLAELELCALIVLTDGTGAWAASWRCHCQRANICILLFNIISFVLEGELLRARFEKVYKYCTFLADLCINQVRWLRADQSWDVQDAHRPLMVSAEFQKEINNNSKKKKKKAEQSFKTQFSHMKLCSILQRAPGRESSAGTGNLDRSALFPSEWENIFMPSRKKSSFKCSVNAALPKGHRVVMYFGWSAARKACS